MNLQSMNDKRPAEGSAPEIPGDGLRILLITNFYPPHVKGGAELAAAHLAAWLARNGQQVGVLTLAPPGEPDSVRVEAPGLTVFRRNIPNVYHALQHVGAAGWKKPFWHVLDHFHPLAAARLREVIAEFRPDVVNTHNLQGLGYNLWQVLGDLDLPVLVALHDLSLMCLRQSMFKNGENCARQCGICRVSAAIRGRYLRSIRRLDFISASRALLGVVKGAFPANAGRGIYLQNPLDFPLRTEVSPTGSVIRLLYAGQVSPHKGVPFLLDVLNSLPQKDRFKITVVGKGGSLAGLQETYRGCDWVRFTGFVAPEAVDGYMREADVLIVPSLWYENQPLVILQARALGLPLMLSDRGGLPELVQDGAFGRVLEAGNRDVWREALQSVTEDPALVARWKKEALARCAEFNVDDLGHRYIGIVRALIRGQCAS